jgi:hypothetical protein
VGLRLTLGLSGNACNRQECTRESLHADFLRYLSSRVEIHPANIISIIPWTCQEASVLHPARRPEVPVTQPLVWGIQIEKKLSIWDLACGPLVDGPPFCSADL